MLLFVSCVGSKMPFAIPDLSEMVQQLRDLFVCLHFEKQLPHALQRSLRDTKPTTQVGVSLSVSLSLSLSLSLYYCNTYLCVLFRSGTA